jgi:diadenosine tetraphosphate (Ap4A) HIT family hydrolase
VRRRSCLSHPHQLDRQADAGTELDELGLGTLIVKPKRHVIHAADLTSDEAQQLDSVLQQAAAVATELVILTRSKSRCGRT